MVYQTSNDPPLRSGGYRPVQDSREAFAGFGSDGNFSPPVPPPLPIREPSVEAGGLLSGIGGTFKRLFGDMNIEDLILIGIGILLLLDGNRDNDTLVILLVVLLLTD